MFEYEKEYGPDARIVNGKHFRFRENDLTRLERFKQWARRNLLGLSGLAIVVTSAITAVILVTRQALKKTAKDMSLKDKGEGKEEGGGDEETDWSPIQPAADSFDWLSDNLLFMSLRLALVLYTQKRR